MTKKQAERWARLSEVTGMTAEDLNKLLRCERTLTNWSVKECGDGSDWAIERDDETDKPFMVYHGPGSSRRYTIADREKGALRRAEEIAKQYGWSIYHQGDPRGCALYLYKADKLPAGKCITGYYSSIGVAVCVD